MPADFLPESHLGRRIASLRAFYGQVDQAISLFVAAPRQRQLGCPPGCGRCCQGFDPDVTPAEVELIAAHLLEVDSPELNQRAARATVDGTCVFFDPDSPFHCTIYAVRPLVCRAFGFTATADKWGHGVFRFCKHMPTDGPTQLAGAALAAAFDRPPPTLPEWGRQLAGQFPDEAAGKRWLSQAVEPARQRLAFYRRLAGGEPPTEA